MKLDELLKEYRESMPASPMLDFDALERRELGRRQRMRWLGVVAAAAAIAIVMFSLQPQPTTPVTPAIVAAPIVRPVEQVAAPIVRPVVSHNAAARKRRPRVVNEFIAIGEASMLPAPQSLQLMRVNLSGARLAALGLLPAGRGMDDRLTADVLMGEDGMARAIRLVSAESLE